MNSNVMSVEVFGFNQPLIQVPKTRRAFSPIQPRQHDRKNVDASTEEGPIALTYHMDPQPTVFAKYRVFSGLLVTTTISSLLLAASVYNWKVSGPGGLYYVITTNRASSQIAVQIISNFLGLIHVANLAILINYATRIRLASKVTSLDTIRFWHALCVQHVEWSMPLRFLLPLVAFTLVTLVPSALWAGSITLVSVSAAKTGTVFLPSFRNATLIHEYHDRSGASVPSLSTTKGFFTYNVGERFLGSLLASASSATTIDGSLRKHSKLDNTRFTYSGRSYGVGASVGLLDDDILGNPLATQYEFQEHGYDAHVTCIYNSTSNFIITQVSDYDYAIHGYLPNGKGPEYADYFGYDPGPIVAIGVASTPKNTSRMLGIAAGPDYAFLNTTQCSIDFQPTLFNVSVGIIGREITVTPVSTHVEDIEPSGNLSYTAIRQFMILSTDQTGLYTSLAGDSFNNSIIDYNISLANAGHEPVTQANATITGLQNSIIAMTDDIISAYAAAQMMVLQSTSNATATVDVLALRFGQDIYIYAVVAVNGVILLLVLIEGWRTRTWTGLKEFDYMNVGALIADTLTDEAAVAVVRSDENLKSGERYSQEVGKIRVLYNDGKISYVP